MENVLWISLRVPYDNVAHAGGKIHNFYLKRLKAANVCNLKLVSFYNNGELNKLDLKKYKIDSILINSTEIEDGSEIKSKIMSRIYSISGMNNYLDLITREMCKVALHEVKIIKQEGYFPNVVILQWTQIITLLPKIKEIFPDSKIVCIEEDVTFLASQRRQELANVFLKKIYFAREKRCIKRIEKKCLEKADLVILNNKKDEKLLVQNDIKAKTWVWTPYFQNMLNLERTYTKNKDILFYGAMNRPENWMSAIWFIENVFIKLKHEGYRFIVIGNKPNIELQKYNDDNQIKILGFVDDIRPYFQNSLCLVAPLLLGAGVKIKIIEGMSSGIPVLTNSIGIEGINARKDEEYFYCEKPEEYVSTIKRLYDSSQENSRIGKKAKIFIRENYNYNMDAGVFCHIIKKLCTK